MNAALPLADHWSRQRLQAWQQNSWLQQYAWLQSWANEHLDYFITAGFPQRTQELWKYTRVDSIKAQQFILPHENTTPVDLELSKYRLADSISFVVLNGRFMPSLSLLHELPQDVVVLDLASAWREYPQRCQQLLSQVSLADNSSFSALNAALLNEGLYVAIPNNLQLTRPIHILHINTAEENAPCSLLQQRHLFDIGENSQVHLFEDYVSSKSSHYFRNVVTHIHLATNAELYHYKLQRESMQAFHLAYTTVEQQKDSRAYFVYLADGGCLSRDDLHIALQSPGALVELYGLYLASAKQHIANYSRISHFAPHTQSKQHYRGIVTEQAQAVFNGKIKVLPNAVQVKALQQNHNLLLSEHAVINTKPELEIYADDIKCSHGATIGQLDPQTLFYLQSRGILPLQAQQMLTRGFADEVFSTLADTVVKTYLQQTLSVFLARLNGLSHDNPQV